MPSTIINTNQTALLSLEKLRTNTARLNRAATEMASGRKINRPSDDAAGYGIARLMDQQIKTKDRALQNVQDGISLLEVAEGSMGLMTDGLQRVRELAIGMGNDTNSIDQRNAYAREIRSILDDMDRLSSSTRFNDVNLLDGSATNARVQVGFGSNLASNTIDLTAALADTDTTATGVVAGASAGSFITSLNDIFNGTTTQINSPERALLFIQDIDAAMAKIGAQRGTLGALNNQLNRMVEFISVSQQNEKQTQSRIQDADIAKSSSEYSQAQVLQQAAVSVLSQSNITNESVLSLLQRN